MYKIYYYFKCADQTVYSTNISSYDTLIAHISPIEITQELQIQRINIHLALISNQQDIWLNLINEPASLNIHITDTTTNTSNNIILFAGQIESIHSQYYGKQSLLKITIINPIIELNHSITRYYSPEEQKAKYPTDTSLDFYEEIKFRLSLWGQDKI